MRAIETWRSFGTTALVNGISNRRFLSLAKRIVATGNMDNGWPRTAMELACEVLALVGERDELERECDLRSEESAAANRAMTDLRTYLVETEARVVELEQALREIANIMDYDDTAEWGCGNACGGCQSEMVEASRIIAAALAGGGLPG